MKDKNQKYRALDIRERPNMIIVIAENIDTKERIRFKFDDAHQKIDYEHYVQRWYGYDGDVGVLLVGDIFQVIEKAIDSGEHSHVKIIRGNL